MSRIITAYELQNRSDQELRALHREIQEKLTRSAQGTAARRNALASLENITRAIHLRRIRSIPRF